MPSEKLTIGLVRRGYSASGGAEAYLKRLAQGIVARGHAVRLFTTGDWPDKEWSFGTITRLRWTSPIGFANEFQKSRWRIHCHTIMSFERVWSCDVYRAGDGVHRAWLTRRNEFEAPWHRLLRQLNRKHEGLLRLERSLLEERRAERVIVNSQMVKEEIFDLYCYRPDMIDIVRNGIAVDEFRFDPAQKEKARAELQLQPDEVGVLFVGSGWERKGLCFAIEAVESLGNPKIHLLVVGRGRQERYQSAGVRFYGEMVDVRPMYAAADIFILPTIYDPFSNACLEALAAGLPVITTRSNGFSEIMEDRIHGSVVDRPDSLDDLRNALEVWSDPTRRSAARPNILKRAAQFDISANIEKTLEILGQVTVSAASTSGKMRNT
jgi:UDP-glucose:(heptosyl)LPS alpha-1,3-glucosyltransferase